MRFWLIVGVLAFVGLCASGPIITIDPKPSPIANEALQATDLDLFLDNEESKVPDLRSDLAKGIVWRDAFKRQPTPVSIVYLHGFSASRRDLSPVVEDLGRALGANIYFARLKAHGLKSGEEFANVTAQDWIDDAREAIAIGHRIGEKVILVGISTGALLASLVTLESDRSTIAGLVLISPLFGFKDWRAQFASGLLGPWLVRRVAGATRSFPVEGDASAYIWTHTYSTHAIVALSELVNYSRHVSFVTMGVPTLILYTHNDSVVSLSAIQDRFSEIRDPRKLLVDLPTATRHEFAGPLVPDNNLPTTAAILDFLFAQIPSLKHH